MNKDQEIGKLQEHARNTEEAVKQLRIAIDAIYEKLWSFMKAVIGFLAAIFLSLIGHIIISYLHR